MYTAGNASRQEDFREIGWRRLDTADLPMYSPFGERIEVRIAPAAVLTEVPVFDRPGKYRRRGNREVRKNHKYLIASGVATAFLLLAVVPTSWLRYGYNLTLGRWFRHSVESRLSRFGAAAAARLNVADLPEKLDILAFKQEKKLELWGKYSGNEYRLLSSYPILAASGKAGPKLREGDRQVPEGIYAIESLHPNSRFYLALKIAYPSEEDIQAALAEKRDVDRLGSAIMLHGKGGSVGCIAVSNEAIEEIFFLTARVGVENTRILIFPHDFRHSPPPTDVTPDWISERYRMLEAELNLKKAKIPEKIPQE